MNLGLNGRLALITGASQGIGLEIAKSLSKEGVTCILIARDEAKLLNAKLLLTGEGHEIHSVDVLDGLALETFIKKLILNRQISLCIHNVGGTLGVKDSLASHADWERVWNFNVGNAIRINNLMIPHMQDNNFGRIVHISSISAESLRGSGPYAAAKAYLNAYVKVLGRSMADKNIVISGILPGAIYAEGGHWDEEASHNKKDPSEFLRKRADFLRHHQAIGRFGRPDEIAPWVLFLCSDHASFAAGALLPIDGGTM